MNITEHTVSVDLAGKAYNIVIGQGILSKVGEYLPLIISSKKICIITDETVAKIYLVKIMQALDGCGLNACPPVILPAGESTKNFQQLQYIVDKCLSYKLDRNSTIIALGGGVIGDIAGFAASILMRGIGFMQIPTTLLSQVDSSVGGKTGINTVSGKNMVGTFYHPGIVLIDTDTLKTLPVRELKAGYAEILKYALIKDAAFFDWLELNGNALLEGNNEFQKYAIDRSCRAKAGIVEEDEDEQKDIRALLNLGHSFGHALEALGGYDGRLLHGEAVGIGMLLAYEFSCQLGLCQPKDVALLRNHLIKTGLMIDSPFAVTAQGILDRMKGDKKNRNSRVTLILARGIGQAFVAHDVNEADLMIFLQKKFV